MLLAVWVAALLVLLQLSPGQAQVPIQANFDPSKVRPPHLSCPTCPELGSSGKAPPAPHLGDRRRPGPASDGAPVALGACGQDERQPPGQLWVPGEAAVPRQVRWARWAQDRLSALLPPCSSRASGMWLGLCLTTRNSRTLRMT